jgi:replicative DNA helicase
MYTMTDEHALAEATILSGGLRLNHCPSVLHDLDFDDARYRVVFSAMKRLAGVGAMIDVRSLAAEIDREPERFESLLRWTRSYDRSNASILDAIGGVAFLDELATKVPTWDEVVASVDFLRRANITVLCPNCALRHRFPLCSP